ncbi:hypothetical protein MRB53_035542 [Persea americana]|uniref:Uncharacterized protein n=2 Tax=Persea americana TaxID=3435 RepID=A0ACC2K5K6_PERAE|nr:hypothetical protein MRB53_035540 [Persea americana]KAJ8616170.1 hypothetical protein MRB53_035542 [Persea americana]
MSAKGSESPRFMTILVLLLIFASASTIVSADDCIDEGICGALMSAVTCYEQCKHYGYGGGICQGQPGMQQCCCTP